MPNRSINSPCLLASKLRFINCSFDDVMAMCPFVAAGATPLFQCCSGVDGRR